MRKSLSPSSTFMLFVSVCLLPGCVGEPSSASEAHQPLETDSGWFWTKKDVEQRLQAAQITQAQANRTLAADGGVCALQASETPVQTVTCDSDFVFECVDLPEVGFTECSTAVRGPECRAEEKVAIKRLQGAAFTNCMIELGWQRKRQAGD